ncbi:uncharacterized protein LOC117282093 [Cryptotermes secundus]|uniref:uncharacterized protein LOC117282093 n=1 Tax=Cryptotermes secundus TaxID=105785 RepID=UPI001454BA4A|nr:uncharacterized protein LOC117282093 [Cryptotermes secundus]
MVRMTYALGRGCEELIVTSAYLPYDSDEPPPSKEVRNIIEYCHLRKEQLIIGCDANAYHTLWESTDINPRGECLMEPRNCPARTTREPRRVPWRNKQLSGLRTKTRRLFNTAKQQGSGTPTRNPLLVQQRSKESQAILMEEALPGDQ